MINISGHDFLTADEAAAALGVQRATLYAYVSRGLLRSEPDPHGHGRGRRYRAADVEALQRRALGRRDPAAVARGALAWGVPVLDSALTLIDGGCLYYRGHDAAALAARGETLERIAALLWLGSLDAPLPATGPAPGPAAPRPRRTPPMPSPRLLPLPPAVIAAGVSWRPFQRLLAWLPLATADDPAAYDLRPAAVVAAGARLLPLMAACAAGRRHPGDDQAAAILARGWAPATDRADAAGKRNEMARLIDAALVLSADHELNVSAFTARCVASARAPLAAVVLGGLAALGGSRHGAYSDRVEALLAEIAPPGAGMPQPPSAGGAGAAGAAAGRRAASTRGIAGAAAVRDRLADRLRRGEDVPGFGHPLYPEGDPRGRLLLDLAAAHRPRSPQVEAAVALAAAAFDLLGERPTLDFGLVALARALGLPPGAPMALFAVGRAAGWIAHALEQYAEPALIRPRARYVGPPPLA